MRGILLLCLGLSVLGSTAFADTGRKYAHDFVKVLEATVQRNDTVIKSSDNQVMSGQGLKYKELKGKAEKLFNPPGGALGACLYATNSAQSVWSRKLLQYQKPSPVDAKLISNSQQDYLVNLNLCKQSIKNIK